MDRKMTANDWKKLFPEIETDERELRVITKVCKEM
jgi:hypothetical protein